MEFLKKGSTGDNVEILQKLLCDWGYSVAVDGSFDNETYNAVKAFQTQHLDEHGRPLVVDGKVGPLTWWSLTTEEPAEPVPVIDYAQMPDVSFGGSEVGRKALQAAIDEMKQGAGEVGGNNMGPFVAKYLQHAGLEPPQSWCASFVSWCYREAVGGDSDDMPFRYSPGARALLRKFKDKGWSFQLNDGSGKMPEPGDIVVWWRIKLQGWQGHIGLVHHCANGFLYTIEGNKSPRVQGFEYKVHTMAKLLGYGRVEE